jgi:hypothetical protein
MSEGGGWLATPGRRLVVIVVVGGVLVVGLVGWWAVSSREQSNRIEQVESAVRVSWSDVDVAALEDAYAAAVVTGGPTPGLPGLPEIDGATLQRAEFGPESSSVLITLRVDGGVAASTCLDVSVVTGSPSNDITTRRVPC